MKKIIALLLAGVICATAAYTAIAAEDDENLEEPVVVTEESEIDDLVAALEGDDQAKEIANDLSAAIKNGESSADVNELLMALADYINDKGFDVADVRSPKVKKILGAFLEDCGVDSEALGAAISETGEVLDNIFGSDDASADGSADAGSDFSDAGSSAESMEIYGVESTTIPDTGYIG